MLFNTPQFLFFLLLFLLVWYIIPRGLKQYFLCVISFAFAYFLGGKWTAVFLFTISILTYFYGLIIYRYQKKIILILFLISLVSFLIVGKNVTFEIEFINRFVRDENEISIFSIIGVSYYSFSAISYIVDIYKGKDIPDKNYFDVANWLSFFPKFIAGPIERHQSFNQRLKRLKVSTFDISILKRGLLICSLGFFYKIIIADRIGLFVDSVWSDIGSCQGIVIVFAMIMYSFQIYFDFAGYSLIAYGVSYAMDLKISSNFNHPYFSESITEFWRRWHVSLSTWLRDYIYIPLGGNRKGKIRQYINILITFIISGIWHGTGWTYVIWGGLHGLFQIMEKCLHLKISNRYLKCLITFCSVSFAWIFFRANSLENALIFVKNAFFWNPWTLTDGTLLSFGIDFWDWIVLFIAIFLSFYIEWMQEKGISIYEKVQSMNVVCRWVIYYCIIICLLVFGIYGNSFDSSNFIYFKY